MLDDPVYNPDVAVGQWFCLFVILHFLVSVWQRVCWALRLVYLNCQLCSRHMEDARPRGRPKKTWREIVE